jgi:hypothetical protein
MSKLLPATGAPVLFACLLVVCAAVCADDSIRFSVDQLETVSVDMPPETYRGLYRRNQRLLRKMAKAYSTRTLRSAGVPEAGIRFMAAVTGVAAGNDVHFRLFKGQGTRLALEFRDVIENDRRALLEFRLKW